MPPRLISAAARRARAAARPPGVPDPGVTGPRRRHDPGRCSLRDGNVCRPDVAPQNTGIPLLPPRRSSPLNTGTGLACCCDRETMGPLPERLRPAGASRGRLVGVVTALAAQPAPRRRLALGLPVRGRLRSRCWNSVRATATAISSSPRKGAATRAARRSSPTSGQVIWFHALPAGETATDFRTQTYQGRPVLTWFQGRRPGRNRLHLQRPLPADRRSESRQRLLHGLSRVPHHALEHGADPRRHHTRPRT